MIDAQSTAINDKIANLRGKFSKTERFDALSRLFDTLYHRRQADLRAGRSSEARGIVVIGASGSGKTTALRRLFATHADASLLSDEVEYGDIASLIIPSPATHKFVGRSTLRALGYPLARDRTSAIMWELAQRQMQARKLSFLHFDEAQDFYSARPSEMHAVINTLKSIMQNPKWPVSVILSGMPALLELINLDPQLSRRVTPVHFEPLTMRADLEAVVAVLRSYADAAQIDISNDIKTNGFVARLMHAGANEFGLLVEMVIDAIEQALRRDDQPQLSLRDFVRSFEIRTGARDGFNPFIDDEYTRINTRRLLDHVAVGGV